MILVCLNADEDGQPVLAAAERLADDLDLRVGVLRVLSDGREDPCARVTPSAWTLRTDAPVQPLLNFMRLNRVRHVVFGRSAWESWGRELWAEGRRTGALALCWTLPTGNAILEIQT